MVSTVTSGHYSGFTMFKNRRLCRLATALRDWTPLAEQGDAYAQFKLGRMYRKGKGVPQDDKTAVKWYKLAAEQGYANAQYNLGLMYRRPGSLYGDGVPQNYKTAVKGIVTLT